MGFGDKFKDLAKQAQDAVAERKEQITEAVDRASVAADARTGGKYSDRIAKVGKKAEQVVEKLSGDREAGADAAGADAAGAGGASAETPAAAAEPPAAAAEPPAAGEEPPAKPRPDATGFPDFG
ncbi:MAG TPA: antitoxin [Solirubrobacteraceae bacterium]|nr:antitoxin [Solirubrobacteraceae bacterium]